MTFRLPYFARALGRKVFIAFAALATTHVQAAIPPAEKILPADTLFVVSIPDCTKLSDILAKSSPWRFWNDLAMKPFHDKFMTKWTEGFIAPLERDLGVKFDDFRTLPQGQLTVAVTPDGWQGKADAQPGLLLLLDTRDQSGQLKTNLANLRKKWTDAGRAIKAEKIRDVEFFVVALSSNNLPRTITQFFPQKQEVQELGKEPEKKPVEKRQLVIGQVESLLVIGSSIPTVERVVAKLTGGNGPVLADEAAFEQNRFALFRDAPLFAWFNAKTFFDILMKLPEDKPNPQAPDPLPLPSLNKMIAGSGLGGLKTVAFTFRDTPEGLNFELFIGAPEATRAGLFKLLAADAKDAGPPPFVPADAVKFTRWRMDGQKAIAAFEKMLHDISPQALNSWNFVLESGEAVVKQTNPDYNLRKNCFASLADDVIRYEKAPRGNSPAELASPPMLLAIGAPNATQLCNALPGVLAIRSGDALNPKTREFLGRKIYTIGLPTAFRPGVEEPVHNLHYAASGSYVAFSTDVATLEEYLRSAESQGKTLRETPGLADAAQRVGGQSTGLFAYENQNETMRLAFDALKRVAPTNSSSIAELSPLTSSIPFAGPEKNLREWMDFTLLPDFPKVAKYFSFTVWAASANADGLTFKYFIPAPPVAKP